MLKATTLRGAVACLATTLFCATAEAQLFRAYLTSDGNDANPCTLQAPCRLLPAALNAVASGGEIWMLDSANYNTSTVTINKSVSILAVPGVVGSVVSVNAGRRSASRLQVSTLRCATSSLACSGAAPGTIGVSMNVASSLTIENSLIANLPHYGVDIRGGSLKVDNTTLRNIGIYAFQLQNGASATISRTQMLANKGGVVVAGNNTSTTTASLSNSVISGGFTGVIATSSSAGTVARIS